MDATALILAAGRGTRMRSRRAKVLHPLCDRPMIAWVVQAVRAAGCRPLVVVGHQAEQVRGALPAEVETVRQDPPRGTGHAVACASGRIDPDLPLLVLPGDAPLVRPETLRGLLETHLASEARCTLLTFEVPAGRPHAYGRVVRDETGQVQRIVEHAHATPAERDIREVNSGIYAFDARWLVEEVLPTLRPHPPKDEIYLTDAVEAASNVGRLAARLHDRPEELVGINDRATLARAEEVLLDRIRARWMEAGVTIRLPATTWIGAGVRLARDVEIGSGAVLAGETEVAEGARIGPHAVLRDTRVGPDAEIRAGSVCESAEVGAGVRVGPMAHLREGARLLDRSRVGNFVEVKKTTLGEGAKANHLTYLGDAEVGPGANVGAGTITCNYDGHGKHPTRIGARAFIGSNTALVAPVRVGEGAIVGAGSTIVEDVPDEALAIARGRQRNIAGRAPSVHERNAARAGGDPER